MFSKSRPLRSLFNEKSIGDAMLGSAVYRDRIPWCRSYHVGPSLLTSWENRTHVEHDGKFGTRSGETVYNSCLEVYQW